MDLRTQKTLRSIQNAFLRLRASKSIERITVKELSELAEISKATFYLHYKDIYDLSEQLQNDVIKKILDTIREPALILSDPTLFSQKIFAAFSDFHDSIELLFSGGQSAALPLRIEHGIKDFVFQTLPDARQNAKFNILLSYQIQGAYYAYLENHKLFGSEKVLEVLSEISSKLPLEM